MFERLCSRRALVGLASIATVALAGAACGGDGRDGDGAGSGAGATFTATLERIPDTPAFRTWVVVSDHAAARAAAGIEAPQGDAPDDAIIDYVTGLQIRARLGFLPATELERAFEPGAVRREIGFNVADLDVATAAGLPPDDVELFAGDISRDAVAGAVEGDPLWSSDAEVVEHGGVQFWSWLGDGEVDVQRTTALRPIGQSLRVALPDDGLVVASAATTPMRDVLDVLSGDEPSLAENDTFGPLAERLDGFGALGALFTDQSWTGGGDGPEPVAPWDALAAGVVHEAGATAAVFLLSYGDEGAAQDNARRLEAIVADGTSSASRQPWAQLLGSTEVTVDGRIVELRAAVDDQHADLWQQVIIRRDSLLATS
jgi:hypothetical protein